jgi:hypothetical protein
MANFFTLVVCEIDRNLSGLPNTTEINITIHNEEISGPLTDGYHLLYGQPSNEISTAPQSNPTTQQSEKIIRTETVEHNVIDDKLKDLKNIKYKIFTEDYQDNLMDELFIV